MSAIKIHGNEYTINKVFSDDFAFEIPHYQRPYRWTTEQAGELLEDLLGALRSQPNTSVDDVAPYFLGCVVLIKQENVPDSKVVDGQQRLTTLTILLSALRETVADVELSNDLTHFLYAKGNKALGTNNRYRLLIRDRDRDFFQTHVQSSGGLTNLQKLDPTRIESISQENIRHNGLFLLEKLKSLDDLTRQRLATFMLNRCVLVVVSSPNIDSAYRIFSVLNNRGLDLSHADILKAEIIGDLPAALTEPYSKKWEDVENEIGVDAFKELFNHIRMIYRKQKLRESVLKEFKEYVVPIHKPKELIDGVIIPLADAFLEITSARFESMKHAEEINSLFQWLGRIGNYDWIPPAIKFLCDHRNDPMAILRFFSDLERLVVYMMVNRMDITRRVERYGKLLAAMEEKSDLYEENSPLQLTETERNSFLAALNGNIYDIKFVTRYVLLRLDSLLTEGEAKYDFENVSIEHVLPQTPEPDGEWCKLFPDPIHRAEVVHTLGNLVLLTRRKNSSAQNFDFTTKKAKYFTSKGKGSAFMLTSQVILESEWTPAVVQRRQEDLLGKLKVLWRL